MPVYESPGPGRVLIAPGGPLVAEPSWTRYDNLALCGLEGFDWTRGRQSEFDVTNTGEARVWFHDRNGTFDGEDFIGLQIMLQLHDPVADLWQPVFRGHIDDMPSEVSAGAPTLTNVEIDCVDIFDYLAGVHMVVGVFGDALPAGVNGVVFYENGPVGTDTDIGRIQKLLNDAGLDPDMYVEFTGNVVVNETLYNPDDDILSALRDAADAEFPGIANVYVDRFGRVVFHGRDARFDPDTVAAGAGSAAWDFQRWEAATRLDVGTTRAQIREFSYNRPRSRIVNSYLAWPELDENGREFDQANISTLVRTDATSISTYGYRGIESPALIIQKLKPAVGTSTGAQQCGLFGDFYVTSGNYTQPRKNVQKVTFRTMRPEDPRAAATWAAMTRMDISDIIELWVAEAGLAGTEFYIEGISGSVRHSGNPAFDIVEVTPNLSPAAYYTDNVFA